VWRFGVRADWKVIETNPAAADFLEHFGTQTLFSGFLSD
jgi:hypothetical protein